MTGASLDRDPDWIPETAEEADEVVRRWTERKLEALRRERGLDDEVETTRKFVVSTIPEFADRFLLELVQNAHDALPASGYGRVAVVLDTLSPLAPELLVANTGTPFRYRDFRALCRMAQSEKTPGEGIGHKGVGFKSVLQVAPRPEIYSAAAPGDKAELTGFRFTFPDDATYDQLIPANSGLPRMTPYSLPVTIPVGDQPVSVRALAGEGYVTVIRLPIRPAAVETVQKALNEIQDENAPILLFLDRIGELRVVERTSETETIKRLGRQAQDLVDVAGCHVSTVDLGDQGRYLLIAGAVDEPSFREEIAADLAVKAIDEQWSEWTGPAPIAVALPLHRDATDDRLYCYLPLAAGATSPLAGHVQAPFAVGLARKGLAPGTRINELLLDAVARLCVDATNAIKEPGFVAAVVDLVAWPRDRARIAEAWERTGLTLAAAKFIPVLGTTQRASFDDAMFFEPLGVKQFTPDAVVRATGAKLMDPALGPRRTIAVADFAADKLGLNLAPSADLRAGWAEKIAAALPLREATDRDLSAWLEFYDDLPRVFEGNDGRALAGKTIIFGEDEELLEAWSETPTKRRRRVQGVFFPSREGDAGDGTTWDGPVPRSLRGSITRVSPRLDWYVPGDSIRRNRPGRTFLEQHGLVRVHRTEDLVRLVERFLQSARTPTAWGDALEFVYRLTRPGPRRPDLEALALSRLKFRVPAETGWIPAEHAHFSSGWTASGTDLDTLVRASEGASPDLFRLAGSLLQAPIAWLPKSASIEAWTELLRLCGVRDGLHPESIGSTSRVIAGSGWRWSDPNRIADDLDLASPGREAWLEAVALSGWPRHEGAEYIASNAAFRLPGQDDFSALSETAKHAFARLIVREIGEWDDQVFEIDLQRRYSGGGDVRTVRTPLAVFLSKVPWLPVSRPGSRGDEDWVTVPNAWFVGVTDREPYFAPIVLPDVRNLVTPGSDALTRLRRFGAHEWTHVEDAGARIDLLGWLLSEGKIQPGFHAQVRNAVEDAWRDVAGRGSEVPRLPELRALVVSRGSRLEALPVLESCFVLATPDRMLELVLASLEEPVLVAPPQVGMQVIARLNEIGSGARLLRPTDLEVEVDGLPVRECLGRSDALISSSRRWLVNLVLLALVLRQSDLRVVTPNVLETALERLAQIRLIEAFEISLRLQGLRREVPAYSRGVVPVSVEGLLAIVWVPGSARFGWAALRRLVPAIADLIGERWARDALENAVRALGEAADSFDEPDDEAYADAFGVAPARIGELLRSQRQVATQALDRLLPVLAYFVGVDAASTACQDADAEVDVDGAISLALAPWRGRDRGFDPDELTQAIRAARGYLAVRDLLGLDFGRFNAVLAALAAIGAHYAPELLGHAHAHAMWAFIASEREPISDALRALALSSGGDLSAVPDVYLRGIRVLDDAVLGPRDPNDDDLLASDPAWQLEYREPPTELMAQRIDRWLASFGAPRLGTATGLQPTARLRELNGRRLREVLRGYASVILAWLGRRDREDVPPWIGDVDVASDTVVVSGALDFHELTDDALLAQASKHLVWPSGLQPTVDLALLGLTPDEVAGFRTEAELRERAVARERRGVDIGGRVVTLDPDSVEEDLLYVISTLSADELSRTPAEIELGAPPIEEPNGGEWPTGARRPQGRPSREKLEAIGLVGETIAYAWLSHQYGSEHVRWMSRNRSYYLSDGDPGDDSCGYDMHVMAGRSPIFIEVKSFTGDPKRFELSEGEVKFARSKARTSTYRVLYIANVGVPEKRQMLLLPNPLAAGSKDLFRPISTGTKFAFTRLST